MTKGFQKKQSKRMLAKRRYKIEKKVKEHHRKLRKASKKADFKKRKPKDPGIPNSLPFKAKVIEELKSGKKREDNAKKLIKEQIKKLVKTGKEAEFFKMNGIERSEDRFANIKRQIQETAKQREIALAKSENTATSSKSGVSNLKSYHKEFQKVVEESDVLIEVLDARDPLGTRCPEVEEALLKAGPNKRLVLLLNKVDLVPRENLENWLKYLRQEFPALAFKANTQRQRNFLSRNKKGVFETSHSSLGTSKGFGASELLCLLKNYCRNRGIKTSINVGVVGLPNVGKSSVINTLKCSRACNTGAVPGVTKVSQKVILDKNIHLIDCPGIVYGNPLKTGDSGTLALRNSVLYEQLDDSLKPIEAILARVKRDDLLLLYKIPDFVDAPDFLHKAAKRFGFLKKGGTYDMNAASKRVLNDWNSGKIKYMTQPPEFHEMPAHISAEIVATMSAGFDFNTLEDETMEAGNKADESDEDSSEMDVSNEDEELEEEDDVESEDEEED